MANQKHCYKKKKFAKRICGRIERSEIRVAKKLSWLEPEVQFAKLSEREANPRLFQKKKFAKVN